MWLAEPRWDRQEELESAVFVGSARFRSVELLLECTTACALHERGRGPSRLASGFGVGLARAALSVRGALFCTGQKVKVHYRDGEWRARLPIQGTSSDMMGQQIGEWPTEPGHPVWWVATWDGDACPEQAGEGESIGTRSFQADGVLAPRAARLRFRSNDWLYDFAIGTNMAEVYVSAFAAVEAEAPAGAGALVDPRAAPPGVLGPEPPLGRRVPGAREAGPAAAPEDEGDLRVLPIKGRGDKRFTIFGELALTGPGPVARSRAWASESGIPPGDRSVHEHHVIMKVFQTAAERDQLNLVRLESFELLIRRAQVTSLNLICSLFRGSARSAGNVTRLVLPSLQALGFGSNRVGDEGAAALAEALRAPGALPSLQQLGLGGNRVGGEGAAAWRRPSGPHGALPSLQALHLSGNRVGGEGAAALAEALRAPGALPSLQALHLSGNLVGDEGAAALAEALRAPGALPSLQALGLGSNRVGDEGGAALAEALRAPGALPSLQQLGLGVNRALGPFGNRVGDEGAAALAEALRAPGALPSLQELDLGVNRVGDEGAVALAEALRAPGALPSLQELGLGGNRALRAPGALPNLQALGLGGNRVGNEGAAALRAAWAAGGRPVGGEFEVAGVARAVPRGVFP
ncbi:unnamed protein product [Prorocentrum cordatum]|uniref:Uncharacterized protein n=1 Tax=Prorocentrum cordatum TaxID=2364126 RepID=A0ABN9UPA2_9DINO|nr:unnamed protein product [Polarella glacialis]